MQQSFDLLCRSLFRVDGHGKTECIPQFIDLICIFRIANSGDGVQLGIERMGGGAAQQIDLIFTCGCNQQISFFDTGLKQDGHRCAVTVDSHDIVS